jgi:hypothetical protein
MAFDLPGQKIQTGDFARTLAMTIERGIKNA